MNDSTGNNPNSCLIIHVDKRSDIEILEYFNFNMIIGKGISLGMKKSLPSFIIRILIGLFCGVGILPEAPADVVVTRAETGAGCTAGGSVE